MTPYAVVSCWALTFAMWGGSRASRGDWEMFRTVSLDDDPPYLVTETERGACKQKGSIPGFYTTAQRTDLVRVWQAVLLPVVLAASVVFAGLSSLGQGRGADFLLNWSAILSAGATFSLPLCWGIPWSRLARHLQKIGCAVAGWSGAERISRRRAMILTDADLFPPGTMQLNGVKVFGEELPKAASYAATLAGAPAAVCTGSLTGCCAASAAGMRRRTTSASMKKAGIPPTSTERRCCWERPPSCARWRCGCRGTST